MISSEVSNRADCIGNGLPLSAGEMKVLSGLREMKFGGCGVRHELGFPDRPVPANGCDRERLLDCCHNAETRISRGLAIADRIGLLRNDEVQRLKLLLSFLADSFYQVDNLASTCGDLHRERSGRMQNHTLDFNAFLAREGIPGTFETVRFSDMSRQIEAQQRKLGEVRSGIASGLAAAIEEFIRPSDAATGAAIKERFLQVVTENERLVLDLGLMSF